MPEFTLRDDPDAYRECFAQILESSYNATLFHDPAFLAYHKDKFSSGERLISIWQGRKPIGVMPLFIRSDAARYIAMSPYGGSFGGLALKDVPRLSGAREIVRLIESYLTTNNVTEFVMTPPLKCYADSPDDTLIFAFIEQGAKVISRELSHVIDLQMGVDIESNISAKARQNSRKARGLGIECLPNNDIDSFWPLIEEVFGKKHGVVPTHTRLELIDLMTRLNGAVFGYTAVLNSDIIAGMLLFVVNSRVVFSFYPLQDPRHKDMPGLTLLHVEIMKSLRRAGFRWLDLGTSTNNMKSRDSLFAFKEHFTHLAQFRETYRWVIGAENGR